MKSRLTFFIICCFLFLNNITLAQTPDFCTQIDLVQKATKAAHFTPKTYDNNMSSGIYKLFLEFLDEDQVNFTQAQVDSFSHLEKNIDNALRNNDCNVLHAVTREYKAYVTARIAFLKDNLTAEQDYTGIDKLVSKSYNDGSTDDDENENEYFDSDESRLKTWSKFLRLEVLSRIARTQPTLSQAQETFKTEELRIRTLCINEELCAMEEFLNDGAVDRAIEEIFLHVYLTYHDPHSAFFNTSEKESYETSLATDQETYGIYVAKNSNDEYFIAHLVPGSAAYTNTKLQENDVILELITSDTSKDLTCTSADAINGFLASSDHKTIEVAVRKKNGNTVKTKLVKRKTAVEENAVRGYLLGDDNKSGYMRIPSFYTDLDESYGLGIANDVAKEIYRLKQENIDGLVIDLRGNGGGSLKEAIDLVGLFIDRGPLSQIVVRGEEVDVAQDFNNGAAYKGPLVVLVDTQSASASELFAATIKVYGRGLIVGQPTYGKATIQSVFPLSAKKEQLGYIKMTKGAFFNVDGSTHQGDGVQPDILLPMIGATRASHEKNEPFYIPLDSINKGLLFKKQKIDSDKIIASSKKRIAANAFFTQIIQQDSELESLLNNYPDVLPLNLKSVFTMIENRTKGLEAVTEVAPSALMTVDNIILSKKLIAVDDLLSKSNASILEFISKDPHIAECHAILKDLKSSMSWE